MKMAICTWNDLVAPVFDVSGKIMIVRVSSGKIETREHEDISGLDNPAKIRRLSALGIEVLVCGAISRLWHDFLLAWGIKVISYVSGHVEKVLRALITGRMDLQKFCMPGCPQNFQAHTYEAMAKVARAATGLSNSK